LVLKVNKARQEYRDQPEKTGVTGRKAETVHAETRGRRATGAKMVPAAETEQPVSRETRGTQGKLGRKVTKETGVLEA
jgi:hypothetical protein